MKKTIALAAVVIALSGCQKDDPFAKAHLNAANKVDITVTQSNGDLRWYLTSRTLNAQGDLTESPCSLAPAVPENCFTRMETDDENNYGLPLGDITVQTQRNPAKTTDSITFTGTGTWYFKGATGIYQQSVKMGGGTLTYTYIKTSPKDYGSFEMNLTGYMNK